MIKAILFDRDGVLINSEIININSSIATLRNMGVNTDQYDETIIMGKHPLDHVSDFVVKYEIDRDDFLTQRKGLYQQMLGGVELFSDTVALLRKVRTQGLLTGLVTSASRETTERSLDVFNLSDQFDVIITFDECTRRKPDPEPYLKAALDLDVDPLECLVIEDSLLGLKAAKDAGMKCAVRINDSTKNLDFSNANIVVDDVTGLLEKIK